MNKPPAFQLYADDFIAGTAKFSDAEVGLYLRLLCAQWSEGSLPDDDDELASYGKGGTPLARVKAKFERGDDGRLRNARMEKVRQEQAEWREKSRQGGLKSAQSRAKGGSKMVEPPLQPPTQPKRNTPVSGLQSPVHTHTDAHIPSLSEVKTKAGLIGVTAESAETFYNHHQGNNLWVNQYGRLINWEVKLKVWGEKDKTKQPTRGKANPPPNRNWDQARIEDCL